MKVYVETGEKKSFATAVDWPGLARGGKTTEDALAALVAYVPRYVKSMGAAAKGLKAPASVDDLDVIARLAGNKTTDFGAPDAILPADRERISERQLDAAVNSLQAAWAAFATVAGRATGKTLGPSGPRGGGRSVEKMTDHVREADGGYVSAVGGKSKPGAAWSEIQRDFIAAVRLRNAGELPDFGPRGGERWPATFAIRRSAWHALDHAWEIEDRLG
ncbi:MAG: hypothetical protein QOJ81_2022 [Chloroflexota bacterium]|nr:hypothetical protein [Chloroflexota bacterium]